MYKNDLTQELINLAKSYGLAHFGKEYLHLNENTNSSIIFKDISYNFHPKSWKKIYEEPLYKKRTKKTHTKTVTKGLLEMQSSNSSDALAMNIFCFPDFTKWKGSQLLFEVKDFKSIEFGHKPKVKKYDGINFSEDNTEVDVFINESIIIECKLTEEGFYHKQKEEVEKYVDFKNVFHTEKLIQNTESYLNYQLIRNILAAHQIKGQFRLLCDIRRPDLVKSFYQTIRCIKDEHINLRLNCEIIFWQDINKITGKELKTFLREKYGI
jgi:hypothetical protein